MSDQADVRSIEALRDFRAALAVFSDEAGSALGAVDMEIRRTVHWLTHEQRIYWQAEIKKRTEKVAMARAELARRKLSSMHGHTSSHTEQKEILEKAEARLREAEKRAQMVKKWAPMLQQAVLEYQGYTRRLSDIVGSDMPRAVALLDRILDALEAYTSVAPPSVFDVTGALGTQPEPEPAGGESMARAGEEAAEEPKAPEEAHEMPAEAGESQPARDEA